MPHCRAATIIHPPRPRTLILIVALIASRLSRYNPKASAPASTRPAWDAETLAALQADYAARNAARVPDLPLSGVTSTGQIGGIARHPNVRFREPEWAPATWAPPGTDVPVPDLRAYVAERLRIYADKTFGKPAATMLRKRKRLAERYPAEFTLSILAELSAFRRAVPPCVIFVEAVPVDEWNSWADALREAFARNGGREFLRNLSDHDRGRLLRLYGTFAAYATFPP